MILSKECKGYFNYYIKTKKHNKVEMTSFLSTLQSNGILQPTKLLKLPPYISATEFENVSNDDVICDWLSIVCPKNPKRHPLQSLFVKGVHHEADVIDKLRKRLGLELPKLSTLTTSREYDDYYHELDMKTTVEYMKKGEPLLYSAFISNNREKVRGIPDLLVRSDYMERYFGIEIPNSKERSVFGNFYYIPVEIKYSSLHFDKTGCTLANIHRTRIYKTQLCVYTHILREIQGVLPPCAFIIGKNDPNTTLGHVYFQTTDNDINNLYFKGLEWLRNVRSNAKEMPFSTILLPNMKVSHPLYDKEKEKIAEYIGEITQYWQCSLRHRYNLLNATDDQIYSWKDPNFDSALLRLPKSYHEKINTLLTINRGEINPIYPKKMQHNLFDWRDSSVDECFIDFETVGDVNENEETAIFLIGIYYKKKYTYFLADTISKQSERKIITDFYTFWEGIGKPKAWNWYAEEGFWNRACTKYGLQLKVNWVDLYKVFFENSVCVKGCKNFKLKSYVRSLYAMGKINIKLPPEDCCSGSDALFLGTEYYEEGNKDVLQPILIYNEFDCTSLYVLLDFIRKEL
jgi:uncharacterized protein YprB with RNaseH-like and TPR domain